MIEEDFWNGVQHNDTTWDSTLEHALIMNMEKSKRYREEVAKSMIPKDDWLCVTIDYHS